MPNLNKIRFTSKDHDEFMSLFNIEDFEGCWLWKGKTARGNAAWKTQHAQQVMMSIYDGNEWDDGILDVIPRDQMVIPTCGDRLCCNPDHLRVIPKGYLNQVTRLPGEIDDTYSIYEVLFPNEYRYVGVTNIRVMARVIEQVNLSPPYGPTWELFNQYRDQGTFTVKILESGIADRKTAMGIREKHA